MNFVYLSLKKLKSMKNGSVNQNYPRVSVIIPTYNRANLIPRAIESVLQQTYENIEIIVVDDGSTDNTKAALKPYFDHITYLTSNHKGTANARNIGMKAADGEYIAFLDSDDTYLSYKLSLQIDFMTRHSSIGMVCTEFSGRYEDGFVDECFLKNYHGIWKQKGWRYKDVFKENQGILKTPFIDRPVDFYIGNIFKYVIQDSLIPSNTILFKKKILDIVGFQNIKYRFAQEYEFVVRICKYYKVAFLNIPTYVLHIHNDQATAFHDNKVNKKKIEFLKDIYMAYVVRNTIKDWAYNDTDFYHQNKILVNNCFSEYNYYIGKFWLKYGDSVNARESFYESLRKSPSRMTALFYWLITCLPNTLQRFALLFIDIWFKLEITKILNSKRA